MKHKVSELQGALLDAAVAKAAEETATFEELNGKLCRWDQDRGCWRGWNPSTDWRDSGPIIERKRVSVIRMYGGWAASVGEYVPAFDDGPMLGTGETPLIAAMRAYVASEFGEEVELP